MNELRIGVIGVGEMGRHHAENVARAAPGAKLAAVGDADRARAQSVARARVDRAAG